MALTPLPPPAILKCGGHILLNAYMRAMHVDRPISPGPPHDGGARGDGTQQSTSASGTLDTVARIAGLIPDNQRLFTPSAQVTPMTCHLCLSGHRRYLYLYLQLTASGTSIAERRGVGFVARPEQARQEAPNGKCGLSARSPLS